MNNKLKFLLRILATILIAAWVFNYSLVVRTMGPRLEGYGNMGGIGFIFICFPAVFLLAIWGINRGTATAVALILGCFGVTHAMGSMEEHFFVQMNKESGAGPTARWLMPGHWLAYDATTGRLSGND